MLSLNCQTRPKYPRRARRRFPALGVSLALILTGGTAAIPIVWAQGATASSEDEERPLSATIVTAPAADEEEPVPAPKPDVREPEEFGGDLSELEPTEVDYEENWDGAQATFINLETGEITGTATQRFARPALSLIKLYLANYVLDHGKPQEATYDVAMFIAALRQDNPAHPILLAMATADSVAADGYAQDFGTVELDGEIGSKWAWSDARDLHASVSYGDGWVAAAAVNGTADELTEFVDAQLAGKMD
ncbi:Hypothetical Protein NG00_00655 [Corynebacterium camporealensis]|uniref:Uncharacterized protein n=1 Tax=Corynebacterium camporealensis TaxID=161896 RepID=A0A0F6QV87_9CORY|nr:hypothetical protein [Corynebacterium camporealensis]AKE38702.1 hypothetical protein UL81_03630 [Corynebacterium camporealensis]AVH87982.1 Hypothetical Protein NG00_00655 [Corynebacterium camporealensis]